MATTKFKGFKPYAKKTNGVSKIVRANYGANWWSMVKEVRERDTIQGELICILCRKPILKGEPVETHHLRSLKRQGGTTSLANLGSVHRACHDSRHPHLAKKRGGLY